MGDRNGLHREFDTTRAHGQGHWMTQTLLTGITMVIAGLLFCAGRWLARAVRGVPSTQQKCNANDDLGTTCASKFNCGERHDTSGKWYVHSRLTEETAFPLSKNPADTKLVDHETPTNRGIGDSEATVSVDTEMRRTHRVGARAEPTSTIRGFPEVDILKVSPSQKFMLVSCRSKRRTYLYPQSTQRSFMARGKDLQEKFFFHVEPAVTKFTGTERKAEIFSVAFSSDDACMVVGERNTDALFVFSVSSKCELSPLWHAKLPGHRLVSGLPAGWGLMHTEGIVCLYDSGCEVELLTRAGDTMEAKRDKFKVGNATAWAHSDTMVAVGGSFMREPRVARLTPRAGTAASKGFTLNTHCILPNPSKTRVTALRFVSAGSPSFNTQTYVIAFMESGECTVYDLASLATHNSPVAVSTFTDTDFAGYMPEEPLRIVTAMSGGAYHEILNVALVRRGRVTVYRQTNRTTPFELSLLTDLHDVQEGDKVKDAIFIQNGNGLATCGFADGRHVRLFTLPEIVREHTTE